MKKAEYEQRGAVIDHQKLQLAALQERLRQHGISDDIPDDMNNEDDSYGGAHTNQSDADDDLVAGFNGLVLEGDDVVFYGVSSPFADHPAPVRPKPRLPAIDGFNHSTSRMYEIRPVRALACNYVFEWFIDRIFSQYHRCMLWGRALDEILRNGTYIFLVTPTALD